MPGFDAGYSIPRGLRRKEKKLGPDDLVKWGDATMPKYPMAPRGMQFVNIEGLVDVSDLQTFKEKFTKELEFRMYSKLEEYDANVQEENREMLLNIEIIFFTS